MKKGRSFKVQLAIDVGLTVLSLVSVLLILSIGTYLGIWSVK